MGIAHNVTSAAQSSTFTLPIAYGSGTAANIKPMLNQ